MPEKKQTNKKKKGVQSLEQQLENTRERVKPHRRGVLLSKSIEILSQFYLV